MLQRDYLMRLIMQLVEAITRSMQRTAGKENPGLAAEILDEAIGDAIELDGSVALGLAPASLASILAVSDTDPRVIEYVAHSLALSSQYWQEAGKEDMSSLRFAQALALADSYGFEIERDVEPEAAMQAFLAAQEAQR